jgi:hypothetical protein
MVMVVGSLTGWLSFEGWPEGDPFPSGWEKFAPVMARILSYPMDLEKLKCCFNAL